ANAPLAWSLPNASSPKAPRPSETVRLKGSLGQKGVEVSAYGLWQDLRYTETGAYHTLPANVQRAIGVHPDGEQQVDSLAPFWRIAVQQQWPTQYVSFGTFGLYAPVFPGREQLAGHDYYTDVGVDLAYQSQYGTHHLTGVNS